MQSEAFCKNALPGLVAAKNTGSMRSLTITLFTLLLSAFSYQCRSQTISFSFKDVTLDSVFLAIQKQTPYRFIYTSEEVREAGKVTLTVKNALVENVLDLSFKNKPLKYSIDRNFVTVRRKLPAESYNGEKVISGIVFNERGEPLEGATVAIKGGASTMTGPDGRFFMNCTTQEFTLIVSFVGYEQTEIKEKTGKDITIHLAVTNGKLNEVQIIGYGTTTKRKSTGDVSTLKADEIEKQPISNPLSALEAQVPGLFITQNTGVAGGSFTVRLRGLNSIASGNDPLFVIDGVPFISTPIGSNAASALITGQGSPLSTINPSDIESIDILKDADATSIYGSRGANGVILITTKKGKAGRTMFHVNVYSGISNTARKIKLLNTPQYLEMRHEAFANDSTLPNISNAPDLLLWDTTRNINWQKILIGNNAHVDHVEASLSGGTDATQFFISGSYHRETSVFPGSFADQKGALHANVTHLSPDRKLHLVFSSTTAYENNNLPNTDFTQQAINLAPDAPKIYDSNGNLNWEGSTWTNPYSYLVQKYKAATWNSVTSLALRYAITKSFDLKANAGFNDLSINEISTTPISSWDPAYGITEGSSVFASNSSVSWIVEPQAEYIHSFSFGNISALAGATFEQRVSNAQSLLAYGFTSDGLLEDLEAAPSITPISTSSTNYKYNAFFSRINYNYLDKYIINFTGRRDGSSRFGPGKQFANFGAVGAGWVFSKESFVRRAFPLLSFGKLRASYGSTGNDQIGDYQFLNSYSSVRYSYQTISGLFPTQLYNPDFRWEINRKFEVGVETGFFKDRLFTSISFYRNRSSNQLVGYPLAPTTGFQTIEANLNAIVQNEGLEIEIQGLAVKGKNWSWTASFNFTLPRNKLISYPNLQGSSYAYQYVIGQPLTVVEAFHFTGVDPKTGLYTFEDVNKDGQITYPEDLTAYKKIAQDYYGGLQNILRYKNFELSCLLQFVKQSGYVYLYGVLPGYVGYNQPQTVLARWQNPGDITNIQRFTETTGSVYSTYSQAQQSDQVIGDASYIRLKNLSFSYQLTEKRAKQKSTTGLKFYLRLQNYFTITSFKGLDPENQSVSKLPPLKTIAVGFEITL